MLPASRRALAAPVRQAGTSARVIAKRRLATAAEPKSAAEASLELPPPQKKRGFLRRILLYTTVFGTAFYAGSTAVALNHEGYRDFFVESVPLGEPIIEYAESQGWDQVPLGGLPQRGVELSKDAYHHVEGVVSRTVASVTSSTSTPVPSSSSSPSTPIASRAKQEAANLKETTKAKAAQVAEIASTKVDQAVNKVSEVADAAKSKALHFTSDVQDLVRQAEEALAEKASPSTSTSAPPVAEPKTRTGVDYFSPGSQPKAAAKSEPSDKLLYSDNLPIGFEPPPGYSLPPKSKPSIPPHAPSGTKAKDPVAVTPPAPSLPLVAPAVRELSSSEPVIAQIASSIDDLAAFLKENPTAASGAKDILETAQVDLVQLGKRIEYVKEAERKKLEEKLEEQAKEYSLKLLQSEVEAQDKIDAQEEEYKTLLEDERHKILQAYRQKLLNELETQSQIINERLKEEVIAQGIEMQRRWTREIKVRVEQERGGRLSKLEDLATGLKKLERVTLDNSSYLDENVRLHTLWSALRAFNTAIDSTIRRPFREELRVLRNVAAARDDPVIVAALDSIDKADVPDVGVEPLPDLIAWFTTSVAPRVEGVALVPDQNAGVLSYFASSILSYLRFKRQGLVPGTDVSSVVARAEHYLVEKDLDSAARELNQLKGAPKILLSDWLAAARRRLEVEQALAVIESQATLSSLLVV